MLRFLLALLVLCAAGAAIAADIPPPFFLDLDTGGHRASVRDLAFAPDGRTLVSASDDKTIRVWDTETGTPLRTIRGEIGPDNEGKVFAVAVSPDGKTIAAGGWFGAGLGETPPYGDVRLFDTATGRMKGVLKRAEFPIFGVAFSPDGQHLAAAGQEGTVFLWRKDESQATGWTFEEALDAESGSIFRVAFALDGTRLAASTEDAGLRLWNLETGERLAKVEEDETWADSPVRTLSVAAGGSRFAVGSDDGRVGLFSAATGEALGELPRRDFSVGSVLLAGERIIVSCGHDCADRFRTESWRLGDEQLFAQYREHDRIVFAGAVSPDGKRVATAGGTRHTIRLWDPETTDTLSVLEGAGATVMAVGIDPKSEAIAWGTQNPCPAEVTCPTVIGRLERTLLLPTAGRFFEAPEALEAGAAFRQSVFTQGSYSLSVEAGGAQALSDGVLVVSEDGKVLRKLVKETDDGARHAAFTLLDGGRRFITGDNDGTLLDYDTETGRLLGSFSGGHTGAIEALAASERLNLLVTGSADQTIGLWNLQTHELIASMFFAGSEWVVWMPQGFYYSSDEGDKLIGWHVNQGQDREGRFIRAGQLKKYLWSPEMVRRAIILRSASAAVQEMRPGTDRKLDGLVRRKPPEFALRVADDQTNVRDGFLAVEVSGQEDGASDAFSILSNSRNVGTAAVSRSVSDDGTRTILEVPVEAGENRVSITATDAFGYLTERSVVALVRKRAEPRRGKLFVAAIGVDDYPFLPNACNGRSCNLRFPVDDAAGFLATVAERTAPMFSGMETLFLVNREALEAEPEQVRAVSRFLHPEGAEPDSDTISDALADFLDRPGPDDTTLLFVAGHGINLDEDYYFVPTDARKSDGDRWKRSTLVDWADIQKAVERTKGTRVMLLDTCHAANAFNPRLEKDAADARIVVLSATAANNTAAELPELGHGVFTYSLLEGLKGRAASADGVRLLGLADFLDREVERLTDKRQKPFFYISNMENIQLTGP